MNQIMIYNKLREIQNDLYFDEDYTDKEEYINRSVPSAKEKIDELISEMEK